VIVQAARNPFATDALTPLYSHSHRFWCSFIQSPDLRQSAERHAVLMESVTQGDPDAVGAASDALMDFLEAFSRAVIGRIGIIGAWRPLPAPVSTS
jgi:DNA-binding GntR family transcriptional regulator